MTGMTLTLAGTGFGNVGDQVGIIFGKIQATGPTYIQSSTSISATFGGYSLPGV